MEAYCLIKVLRHTGSLNFHRGTCASSSCLLCPLSSSQQRHSLLLSSSVGLAESRILPAAPANTRPRTPLISFCTVQLRTLCAAHSLATLCFFTISGPGPRGLPRFWGSMVFCHAPIPRKESVTTTEEYKIETCSTIPMEQDFSISQAGFREILELSCAISILRVVIFVRHLYHV